MVNGRVERVVLYLAQLSNNNVDDDGRFWTYGRGCKSLSNVIAPFLVRVMPPAFALELDLERDAKLFY
jgi:hypothetical protein